MTNILVLNASVGAAGKGFPVVADKVRNLAAKSGNASKSAADLIDRTVNTIKSGMTAANAEMLSGAVLETSSISKSVSEIADVSEEQLPQSPARQRLSSELPQQQRRMLQARNWTVRQLCLKIISNATDNLSFFLLI